MVGKYTCRNTAEEKGQVTPKIKSYLLLEDCSEFKQVQNPFRVFMVQIHLCGAQQNTSFISFSISAKCLYFKLSFCGLSSSLVVVIPVCV